jgi:hypothetical protein
MEIPPIANLRELDSRAIGTKLATTNARMDSHTLESSKLVVILKERQPSNFKTLKKWVKKVVGLDVRSELYKVAVAWQMVTEMQPDQDGDKIYASISEPEFDRAPLRWHMLTSAILNRLDKEHPDDHTLRQSTREAVAVVYRTLSRTGADQLKNILKALDQEEKPEEEEIAPLTAEFLTELAKRSKARLEVTKEPAVLEFAAQVFQALADLANSPSGSDCTSGSDPAAPTA